MPYIWNSTRYFSGICRWFFNESTLILFYDNISLAGRMGAMNLKERAGQLMRDIPAVYLALKDAKTPVMAKVLAFITVVYAFSPIDLIPDFIPVLGYLDDLIILPSLVVVTAKLIPEDVWLRCKSESEGMWDGGKPKKWYYALPILVLWILIIVLISKAVLS